jgi:PQQ system protein
MVTLRWGAVAASAVLLGAVGSAQAQGVGEILRLLRPEVLRQLNGDVVRLVNFLPEVDGQNKAMVGRLFAHGGLGHAKRQADGSHRFSVRIPSGQFIWRPAIIVMGHGGDLDIDIENEDDYSYHAVFLPNNGGRVAMMLPQKQTKSTRITLNAPGMYWFGCPVANHAGRGMLGLIIVRGEVPDEAKLDRPRQKRQ